MNWSLRTDKKKRKKRQKVFIEIIFFLHKALTENSFRFYRFLKTILGLTKLLVQADLPIFFPPWHFHDSLLYCKMLLYCKIKITLLQVLLLLQNLHYFFTLVVLVSKFALVDFFCCYQIVQDRQSWIG